MGEPGSERARHTRSLAQLLALHRESLTALFDKTLNVIEDALEARKIFLVRGVVVDGGRIITRGSNRRRCLC